MVLYYTLNQLRAIWRTLRRTSAVYEYFKDIWNPVELFVLSLFYAAVGTRVSLWGTLYPDPIIFEPYFIDYGYLTAQYATSFNLDALCVLAFFFKAFKFLQLTPDLNMLWSVLVLSALDLLFFLFLLLLLLLAFAMMAEQASLLLPFSQYVTPTFSYITDLFLLQMLGTSLGAYKNKYEAGISLFLVLLGQFDVPAIVQANRTLGFVLFFVYVVVMFFILQASLTLFSFVAPRSSPFLPINQGHFIPIAEYYARDSRCRVYNHAS